MTKRGKASYLTSLKSKRDFNLAKGAFNLTFSEIYSIKSRTRDYSKTVEDVKSNFPQPNNKGWLVYVGGVIMCL